MHDMGNRADNAAEDRAGTLHDGRNVRGDAPTRAASPKRGGGRLLALMPCIALASFACSSQGSAHPLPTFEADMLKTAADFAVLGASAVTNTDATVITGNLGLSPGTAVTGFPPGVVHGATDVADGAAAQGQVDLDAAWTTLKNESCGTTLTNPDLGGQTLTPGVYCFTSPTAALTGALTLDAAGNPDAVFVFQIASTLTTASASSVVTINGASGCNVFWEVGSSATLGTGTQFQGSVLASASITATTGASVAGRLLAHAGAVTLDINAITACVGATGDAGQDSAAPGKDAGPDTSIVDAGHDVSIDAGKDVTTDAGHDVSTVTLDAGKDASIDGDAGCATSTPCP